MSEELRVYTYSELQQFTDCEREYEYRYEKLLEPVFEGVARPIGAALHVGLEKLYTKHPMGECIEAARDRYYEGLEDYIIGLNEPHPKDETPEADALRKVNGGWFVVRHLLEHYPWKDVDAVVGVEAEIVVDMGAGRAYKGRIDRIMLVNGQVWNHDTKTSGMQPAPIIKTMRLRHQFAGYKHLVDKWLAGEAIEGPEVPASLKGKGCDGTVLDLLFKPRVTFHRKNKQYTGEVSCKGEGYHREPLHVDDDKCCDFEQWFHETATRIESRRGGRLMNTQHCFQYNSVCKFFELCRFSDAAPGEGFKVRKHKHDYGYGGGGK